jgi:NADPH-dependent glutamate synthase beta subunit-like oxidoreductase/glutamate synthase domain-containing protein 3/Pyruvate/2-oxoacid:ferredoxin oxidoreductase delta subunit
MLYQPTITISGIDNGIRVDSRILEERIQKAVDEGHRWLEIIAHGQHGIGGRLWRAENDQVIVRVLGTSGQRLGSMGFPNTLIDVIGPASDDVGWLNAGAHIIIHGNATNGVGNAMTQGKVYIAGDIGARGMTMTKHNPRFVPPELWVLGAVGDFFAEFMAGGIAVICGYEKEDQDNVLGYRPCVGMVGGKIFFRGSHRGFSDRDVKLADMTDDDWQWLVSNMKEFMERIDREGLLSTLVSERNQWKLLLAKEPSEKRNGSLKGMHQFRQDVWDKELGEGGLIGDISKTDRSPIDVIATGDLRRYIPVWENHKYLPPCNAYCPTGIPVQKRWELIRNGLFDQAVDLAMFYTPFPATVCGYLCPHLCMQHCTRQTAGLPSLDIGLLGKASLQATPPEPAPATGRKIAIIGGGAAGLSVAWQLWLKGHKPVIYEARKRLGGKITDHIPRSRIPDDVVEHELHRISSKIRHINLKHPLTRKEFLKLKKHYDFIVIATGAQKPRMLKVAGHERAICALEFLQKAKLDQAKAGAVVVIIGAGNVGCDVASEAARLGAQDITLVDIQRPAAYGIEKQQAEAAGARFLWPNSVKAITVSTVELASGETLPADTVVFAIGDQPDLDFLPAEITTKDGFVVVNTLFQTSDPQVFAIGDIVKPGLLTEAIGAGSVASEAIEALLKERQETKEGLYAIDPSRVKLEYYDPRAFTFNDSVSCAIQCASCGACRDCGLCETICPQNAISRHKVGNDSYEYKVDADRCIGCGFCAGACPCGIWQLIENEPVE